MLAVECKCHNNPLNKKSGFVFHKDAQAQKLEPEFMLNPNIVDQLSLIFKRSHSLVQKYLLWASSYYGYQFNKDS